MYGIMLTRQLLGNFHHFGGNNLKSFVFKSGDDSADEMPLHRVRLNNNQRSFNHNFGDRLALILADARHNKDFHPAVGGIAALVGSIRLDGAELAVPFDCHTFLFKAVFAKIVQH